MNSWFTRVLTKLNSHDLSSLGERSINQDTATSVTRNLRNLAITYPIRSKFHYCNLMYTVATHLIEKRSGLPFSSYLQQRLFKPLGMKSTHLHRSAVKSAGLASRLTLPYSWNKDTRIYRPVNSFEEPEAQGASAIYTTANDMILYICAMLKKSSPLTSVVVSELTKPRILLDDDAEDLDLFTSSNTYALGWKITFYRNHRIISHEGVVTGYSCVAFLIPELNFGCCALGNTSDAGSVGETLIRTLIDNQLHVPSNECIDWNERAQNLRAEYKGDSKEDYEEVKNDLLDDGGLNSEPQTLPLETYTGKYHNAGYHEMQVQIKNGQLFIDANDRSMRFTLTFEHIREQRIFIANLIESEDDEEQMYFKAEFALEDIDQGDGSPLQAARMGLQLEPELEQLIWFDRVKD